MTKQKECCGFDCNQGRSCPLRERRAEPPTVREWIFCLTLLALGLTLSAIPFVRQEISVDQNQVK